MHAEVAKWSKAQDSDERVREANIANNIASGLGNILSLSGFPCSNHGFRINY